MPKFFAASTGGFYWDGDTRPADAVEISDELHAELLEGQTAGGQIVAGEDGFPRLDMPPPIPPIDRARRDASAAVKARYAAAIAAGMPYAGRTLQIDDESCALLTSTQAMAALGALPPGFAWRMADNAFLPLDAPGLTAMALAAGGYVYSLLVAMWAALDAIRSAETVEAVQAVVEAL